ncbi:hypothetical protein FFLO_05983 [Filobasidium floriforme]|uniref:Uncharacterized protein n=1 Tax=Filobasidium floriforme TaxID=5210 RepID=A0A8K0JFZ8_9TREE|nr:uncharacterized protein HD553DRAFT_340426 [Filobasidium floriforme]KAG7528688.1 hypothetical protein FFLO_05983 [Filobasidium floriforme]KAH8087263.1 hypothetical protein HD553DRAFT_340426 [Filobasidium floriforme]
MADKLLIKLEKQWGKIKSQWNKVDSLHRIVTNVIQHGEDIGALKAENTLLKDENKKKEPKIQQSLECLRIINDWVYFYISHRCLL